MKLISGWHRIHIHFSKMAQAALLCEEGISWPF